MKRLVALAALFLVAAAAMPASAQAVRAETDRAAPIVALAGSITGNIGIADTVILFYGAFEGDPAEGDFIFNVNFLSPDGKEVVTQGIELGPIVPGIFEAAFRAHAIDPGWRAVSMVIDRGEPRVTFHDARGYDVSRPFKDNLAAETAKIFPGIPRRSYPPVQATQ